MADGKRVPPGTREPYNGPQHPRHAQAVRPGYALAPHHALAWQLVQNTPGVFATRGAGSPANPLPVRIGFNPVW